MTIDNTPLRPLADFAPAARTKGKNASTRPSIATLAKGAVPSPVAMPSADPRFETALLYELGCSYGEIAARLGLTIWKVRDLLGRTP